VGDFRHTSTKEKYDITRNYRDWDRSYQNHELALQERHLSDSRRLTPDARSAGGPAGVGGVGSWVIKAVPAPDNTIDGQVLVTTNFPATPADVSSATAEVAHMWGYVQQVTPISGASLVRVIVYKQ
jgi:hypothetical protein